MANTDVFQYKANPNSAQTSLISADDIQKMSMPEFLQFQNKLSNVRRRVRYDMAVYEKVIIAAGTEKAIFRKGIGQEETFATSDTEYKKTRVHTNMYRNGEFEAGSLVIVTDICACVSIRGGVPTAQAAGVITNAKPDFTVSVDAALALQAWLEQTELIYREGETEIVGGLLSEFPQNRGISGFAGSIQTAIAQNVFMPSFALRNPRVLAGGDDFSVLLRNLAAFDLTAATGINQQIVQKVELETIEIVNVKV